MRYPQKANFKPMPKPFPPCPFQKLSPSQLKRDDRFFMQLAYNQALEAWHLGEVPIGAVIVHEGTVIASAHNRVEASKDPTAHAEILAITQAAHALGDWRLNGTRLYVTKEPCPMCSGATVMSRIDTVIYGVKDPKMGCMGGAYPVQELPQLNHKVKTLPGIFEEECHELLQTFFALKRAN